MAFLKKFESIEEAGWFNRRLYGDTKLRLAYIGQWTPYKSKGCFDFTCSGFVQRTRKWCLVQSFTHCRPEVDNSSLSPVGIFQDPKVRSNWWLNMLRATGGILAADAIWILTQQRNTVEWGGEVFSSN
ncbi:hypothetical protein SDJN02_01363, partial [Cucurbita argyrosperma subsp. argyrosperma]